ncbi:hypothetical protein A3D76_00465 [Candidatus Roizmanbacteria bacterium RIFCSPHIGHO2_02_FULL_37_9b]|nr:MAG: hypothetical protein A3D76_00465 [Candidatus Roizmanbacteria bacterium RIFCSPHIGHO2_02_FULL_37_9b]
MINYILGAGAQGRVASDILVDTGKYKVINFIDDDTNLLGKRINGLKVIGNIKQLLRQNPAKVQVHIAIGNPVLRLSIAERIRKKGIRLMNVIHPSAVIVKSTVMGAGNMIGANAVINSNTKIGDNNIINTAAVVEHDCVIEDGTSISPKALIGGRVKLKKGAFICSSAVVLPRRMIGEFAVVAAGSLVTKDVKDKTLVMGLPAKLVEKLGVDFNWDRLL